MKKQIIKKRISFIVIIIFLVSIMAINNSCNKEASADNGLKAVALGSTIVYTNVNPDSTIVCTIPRLTGGVIQKSYNLDLNNDDKADFVLWASYQSGSRCTLNSFNSFVSASPSSGNGNQIANVNLYAEALDSLTTIDASL